MPLSSAESKFRLARRETGAPEISARKFEAMLDERNGCNRGLNFEVVVLWSYIVGKGPEIRDEPEVNLKSQVSKIAFREVVYIAPLGIGRSRLGPPSARLTQPRK
jgi:hypothetical protein